MMGNRIAVFWKTLFDAAGMVDREIAVSRQDSGTVLANYTPSLKKPEKNTQIAYTRWRVVSAQNLFSGKFRKFF
jgi:hypothetical protein